MAFGQGRIENNSIDYCVLLTKCLDRLELQWSCSTVSAPGESYHASFITRRQKIYLRILVRLFNAVVSIQYFTKLAPGMSLKNGYSRTTEYELCETLTNGAYVG